MKVLVAAWTAPFKFKYGGMSTFIDGLVSEMLDRGYEVISISMSPMPLNSCQKVSPKLLECNIFTNDLSERGVDLLQPKLLSLLEKFAPMVDYALFNDYHMALGTMVSKRYDIPTGLYIHTYAGSPEELLGIAYSDTVFTNSYMNFSVLRGVVQLSKSVSGWVNSTPRLTAVYPAVTCPETTPKAMRLEGEGYRVGVLARNQWNKNVEGFIKAVEELNKRGVRVTGYVAGHGWSIGWLSEYVYSLGELYEEEKWSYLRALDLYVHPAIWEPFGLAPLEAVCVDVPAILSKRTGASEVLPTITFDPDNINSIAEAIMRGIEERDSLLRRQKSSHIMRRTWKDVLNEIERYLLS